MSDYEKTTFHRATLQLDPAAVKAAMTKRAVEVKQEPVGVHLTKEDLEAKQSEVSVKHDSAKPAVQYIPMEALFAMGEAYGYGAKKYGGYNFQLTGLEVTRCLAASVRHIFQFLAGQDNDPESGLSHLGHAMAAIGMAIYSLKNHPSKDDRFKKAQN